MPNPSGKNQLPGGQHEVPYGGVKKATQLSREAPMSGAPVSALNAPRRAQRRAVKGQAGRKEQAPVATQKAPVVADKPALAGAAAPAQPVGAAAPPPPNAADFWRAIASIPGISPLAKEYAQRVQGPLVGA